VDEFHLLRRQVDIRGVLTIPLSAVFAEPSTLAERPWTYVVSVGV
jgi:hypothetical protein